MAKKNLVQSLLAAFALTVATGFTQTQTASADSPNGPYENVAVSAIRLHDNGDLYVAFANALNHCPNSNWANYYRIGNVNSDAYVRSLLSLAQGAYLSGRKVTIWTGGCNGEYGSIQWMAAL